MKLYLLVSHLEMPLYMVQKLLKFVIVGLAKLSQQVILNLNDCMLSHFSRVWLLVTLWTVAHQAPLSLGFSRQESWSGLPCPPPGDLSDPGIKPATHVFCIGSWILYHWHHLGSHEMSITYRRRGLLTGVKISVDGASSWVALSHTFPQRVHLEAPQFSTPSFQRAKRMRYTGF